MLSARRGEGERGEERGERREERGERRERGAEEGGRCWADGSSLLVLLQNWAVDCRS